MTPQTMQPSRPDWFDDELYPYESRFVAVEGARIHYIDEGEGPVLLMAHGNPSWSFLYRHLVRGLRGRFRVIAWDHPGFGLSRAPAGYGYRPEDHARVAAGLIEALDLRDITLMIQDWGGPIGLGAALAHPDRMRALIVGNTWFWPVEGDRSAERFSKLLGGPLGRFLNLRFNFFPRALMPLLMKKNRPKGRVKRMYTAPFPTPESRYPVAILPKEILGSSRFLRGLESNIPVLSELPVLIVWPTKDLAFQQRHRERWQRTFPNHETVILDGVGHFIQEEAPERVTTAILDWWDGRKPDNQPFAKRTEVPDEH
ncbi:MAG: alpha/beta fold hydrolase [Rubrobacteraceae bacterium]